MSSNEKRYELILSAIDAMETSLAMLSELVAVLPSSRVTEKDRGRLDFLAGDLGGDMEFLQEKIGEIVKHG